MSPPIALVTSLADPSDAPESTATRPKSWGPAPVEAFPDRDAHIRERLTAVRARVRSAIEQANKGAVDEHAVLKVPAHIRAAEARVSAREDATRGAADVPAVLLRERLGLSATEDLILWTLLAHELCPATRKLMRLLATEEVSDPTTDVIRRVVYGDSYSPDAWRELSPDGTLRRLGLLERTDRVAETPEHRQTWRMARRAIALLHGVAAVDDSMSSFVEALADVGPAVSELVVGEREVARVRAAFESPSVVIVSGRVGQGRRSLLHAVARERGLGVLMVRGQALANDREQVVRQFQAIRRECLLLGLVPLVRDLESVGPHGEVPDRLDLLERELPGLVLGNSARSGRAPVALHAGGDRASAHGQRTTGHPLGTRVARGDGGRRGVPRHALPAGTRVAGGGSEGGAQGLR